jgi:hypothetical protein
VKTCRKKKFDRIKALLILVKNVHRTNREEKRAYYCRQCRAWHLTSQPRKEPKNMANEIVNVVLVHVVFSGDDRHEFAFSEMTEGRSEVSPGDVSDDEMKWLAATFLDRQEDDFKNMVVSRPETGQILIAPKPVFGSA